VSFNPQDHLMPMKGGKKYLPVAARLMWLNDKYERFTINTEFLRLEQTYAVAKAHVVILDDEGQVLKSAEGTKREDKGDFADFESKAETGAIGRALGMLGFGTQFAPEFDETDTRQGEPRIVDTPQEPRKAAPKPASEPAPEEVEEALSAVANGRKAYKAPANAKLFSEGQVRRTMAIAGKLFPQRKGDALVERACEAASRVLGSEVADLAALTWQDGKKVMDKFEELAVGKGLWEAKAE
jgi:hypothetical protein